MSNKLPKHIQEMTQLTHNIFCVEVPDDAQDFIIKPRYVKSEEAGVLIWFDYRGASAFHVLPHPYFDFLFTTKGATEEQARQVVGGGKWDEIFKHYIYPFFHEGNIKAGIDKAVLSLESLLRSRGCNTERNYAIIKLNDGNQNI